MKTNPKTNLYAVILAGGAGERLWPISRVKKPKYAMKITGSKSIIQQTLARLKGLVPTKNIFIVTTKDQKRMIKKELEGTNVTNFLIEPCPKNTAAAIGLASVCIREENPKATVVVLPADHYIKDEKAFQSDIKYAAKVADNGSLVTIGVKPVSAFTGYGYIKVHSRDDKGRLRQRHYKVERFVEKPNRRKAEEFFRSRKYFWNAGMFAWKVNSILDGIREYMPRLYSALLNIEGLLGKSDFDAKVAKIYKRLDNVSIDYGIMEKARNVAMVAANFGWTDLGSWISLEDIYKKDHNENIYRAFNINYDTKGSIIFGPSDHLIATCGIRDLIIVHTKDATLVASRNNTQEIKELVNIIRKKCSARYL